MFFSFPNRVTVEREAVWGTKGDSGEGETGDRRKIKVTIDPE